MGLFCQNLVKRLQMVMTGSLLREQSFVIQGGGGGVQDEHLVLNRQETIFVCSITQVIVIYFSYFANFFVIYRGSAISDSNYFLAALFRAELFFRGKNTPLGIEMVPQGEKHCLFGNMGNNKIYKNWSSSVFTDG